MISRLEEALARVIDGGVASLFRLRVQPADMGRRLEHALLASRRTSMGHAIGANHYSIALNPADFDSFAGWDVALAHELEAWLAEVAYRHGITMTAPLQVTVAADPIVHRRNIQVTAEFSREIPPVPRVGTSLGRLIPLTSTNAILLLRSVETLVGRAESNDLVINAPEVSRHHARLVRSADALEVLDLDSRNGTWVNGHRVVNHQARSGDEIAFGAVRFRLDLP